MLRLELRDIGRSELGIPKTFDLFPTVKKLLFRRRSVSIEKTVSDPKNDVLRNPVRAKDVGPNLRIDGPKLRRLPDPLMEGPRKKPASARSPVGILLRKKPPAIPTKPRLQVATKETDGP